MTILPVGLGSVGRRRELSKIGGFEREGAERLLLIPTTHGPEIVDISAFLATLGAYRAIDVCRRIWTPGAALHPGWLNVARRHGVGDAITLEGPSAGLAVVARDALGEPSGHFRALFVQEITKGGVLMPCLAHSLAHGTEELEILSQALDSAFAVDTKALTDGYEPYPEGPPLKPVFQKAQ